MSVDASTLSSYTSVTPKECDINATINWDSKTFSGAVTYALKTEKPDVTLDTSYLEIKSVKWDRKPLDFKLGARQSFLGSPLYVSGLPVDTEGHLTIEFSTTEQCTGLQWLAPEQTSGGKVPFMYSQCEPIHARSSFPCFDTPSVKLPFKFSIISKYPVLVSGLPSTKSEGNNIHEAVQKVPIPSYLFAIASGNLESRKIGPRSLVWAEPETVAACQWEFEADVENQLRAAEQLVFPYEWGQYNVLVLPPSFCFGGMENPVTTFATPTLIAGDRTLVNVIAHELAHSWSGNLVTNSTWSHFWLNEGWTVYLERRILGKLHGEVYRNFAGIEGWHDLTEAIAILPAEHTKLVLDIDTMTDPDDTFSTVPYEKGSTFLWHLEIHLGRDAWDKFIPKYFSQFKYKSLTTQDFVDCLYANFDKKALDAVDWQLWLHTSGLPPKPKFDEQMAVPCTELASKWLNDSNNWKQWASKHDVDQLNPLQVIGFLNNLLTELPKDATTLQDAMTAMGQVYELGKSRNTEVKYRWLQVTVRAGVPHAKETLASWLGEVGRMKFVRPSYVLLNKVDPELARATFEKHKNFYHAICRAMVEKDLHLSK